MRRPPIFLCGAAAMTVAAAISYGAVCLLLTSLDERIGDRRLILELAAMAPLWLLIIFCRLRRSRMSGND